MAQPQLLAWLPLASISNWRKAEEMKWMEHVSLGIDLSLERAKRVAHERRTCWDRITS
ncbi:hypothetical protein Fmac_026733 [Flemingia macrophylla]|uniref:Uncharacterized protein n=1 Tax=Flemingia macrophylla TaxID=520843 RepID=A0ABD1LFP8_9FABA